MSNDKKKTTNTDPLHGVKLQTILEKLVEFYGWEMMSNHVNINCFKKDQSIKSSLKFLRNKEFEWARRKVEMLYLKVLKSQE